MNFCRDIDPPTDHLNCLVTKGDGNWEDFKESYGLSSAFHYDYKNNKCHRVGGNVTDAGALRMRLMGIF